MSDASILAAIANLATVFDQRMTALEDRMTALEDRMTALEASHRSLRVDLMARMDRLQDEMTGMRDDIAVSMGASETVRRSITNVREELAQTNETVYQLSRKLNRMETDIRELKGGP